MKGGDEIGKKRREKNERRENNIEKRKGSRLGAGSRELEEERERNTEMKALDTSVGPVPGVALPLR